MSAASLALVILRRLAFFFLKQLVEKAKSETFKQNETKAALVATTKELGQSWKGFVNIPKCNAIQIKEHKFKQSTPRKAPWSASMLRSASFQRLSC